MCHILEDVLYSLHVYLTILSDANWCSLNTYKITWPHLALKALGQDYNPHFYNEGNETLRAFVICINS